MRFLIKLPPMLNSTESAIIVSDLEALYDTSVREHLPRSIMDAGRT